jgi:hypothetical protein
MNVHENYCVYFELNPSRKDNMAVGLVGWFMVFNATFNNISVISWRSVLLVGGFVSDLRQVGGFLQVLQFPPTNKTDRHDITEILLKVALNTINQPTNPTAMLSSTPSEFNSPRGKVSNTTFIRV